MINHNRKKQSATTHQKEISCTVNHLKLISNILGKSSEAVQITDWDGVTLLANKAFRKMFASKQKGKNGKNIFTGIPLDVFRKTIAPILQKKGKWEGELLLQRKDGSVFPVRISSFLSRSGMRNPLFIINTLHDLTGSKTLENAYRLSQQKYADLFRHSSDAIVIYDLYGTLIDVNNSAAERFGIKRSKLLSLSLYDLLIDPERDRIKATMRKISPEKVVRCKTVFKRYGNETFPAELRSSMIQTGNEIIVQGIICNVPVNRKTDQRSGMDQEKLVEQIKARTHDLLEANENLQIEIKVRKQVEKTLLTYQQQLQSLTSQIAMIEEREKRRIASELHDCIGQTLALAKIKIGLLNKSSESKESRMLLKEIIQLIEEAIKETRTLTFELSPPVLYELGLTPAIKWLVDQFKLKHKIPIEMDIRGGETPFDNNVRFILFQAVRELLINIIKHAQATKATIRILLSLSNIKISVEDNGIGFSLSSESYSGYGLFNIRERINHMKGHFEIKSLPGRGTLVTLVTPLRQSDRTITERIYHEKNSNLIS